MDEKKLFMKPFDVDCEFWLEVYRDWRTELRDYNLDDVKRMKIFWDDFKHELRRQGASEVVDSLGHRCSVAEIKDIEDSIFDNSNIGDVEKVDEYENSHRKCMPSVLSLMYRFVNGQKYRSRTVPKHGMFGGYSKYGEVSNVMFLSLEDLPSISDAFRAICQNYAATSDDLFNSITSINRDAYRDYHMHDNFLPFAFCASGGKVFVLGRSNSVCVLTAERKLLYCNPIPPRSSCPFLDWLEDYIMCLKNDIYRYESTDIIERDRISRLLVLYPLPKPSCQDPHACFQQILNSKIESMQSVAITEGIEVRAGAVFVPEQSSRGNLIFVYTIRLRLIADHQSRDPRMTSARLTHRHWRITSQLGGAEQHVDGEGVIGLYPHLRIGDECSEEHFSDGWFGYQSQTVQIAPGGTLRGFMDFAAFDKFGSNYKQIQVQLGEISFIVPDYIR